MGAGIPISVPSHTITQACISSVQCLTTGAEKILAGQADVVLAGGRYKHVHKSIYTYRLYHYVSILSTSYPHIPSNFVSGCETFSDVPIRFSKPIRERLLVAPKAMKKGAAGVVGLLKGLKLKDLAPEAPAIANYTTGEVMGHSSDRLAAKFGVSRHDQDEFTVMSHTRAAKAHKDGIYLNEIIPVDGSSEENGIKGDSNMEKVSKLKPGM